MDIVSLLSNVRDFFTPVSRQPEPEATRTDVYTIGWRAMLEELGTKEPWRDERIRAAFERFPRSRFVKSEERFTAIQDDYPIYIDCGQTISDPSTVKRTVEEANPQPMDRVLDVGTGSGYQAAVLSRLAREVVTIERHEKLYQAAQERLVGFGVRNVRHVLGSALDPAMLDGTFDVIVSAAEGRSGDDIPALWLERLNPGGRLIHPIDCSLHILHKISDQVIERRSELWGRFVPLI